MSLKHTGNNGFTLFEMMVTVGIGAFMLVAIITSSIALQRTFNAVDNYFEAEVLQIRVIDFLSRDVKRSFIVTSSTDYQTVACIMPNYIIQAGDSDAGGGNANVGKRRTPTVTRDANGTTVNYLTRTVSDAVTSSGSTTLTSLKAQFTSADLNKTISGAGIPAGTTIKTVNSLISVTMLNKATVSSPLGGTTATIGAQTTVIYSVSSDKQSVERTENGVSTTVATTADQLVPLSRDIELSNTEFTISTITFRPVFTSTDPNRSGTKLFSTAYLRNKRRG